MNIILIVVVADMLLFILEQITPNTVLPKVSGWYLRCILLNSAQALVVLLGGISWDHWLQAFSLFDLSSTAISIQIITGYLVITFVYYWWHRARHEHPLLWRLCHQTHHSPTRLEVITSFYKHPIEVLINGVLSSTLLFSLLGLAPKAAAIVVLITGIAELFYHMNLKTPHWLGYVFQRPEMHRIHHQRGVHRSNYSDLPIWDMLFGTYANPEVINVDVGFSKQGENRFRDLLLARRVPL